MKLFQTTNKWVNWWAHRKIDWRQAYLSTWNHPHRQLLAHVLGSFNWLSLLEIGCGGGANLVQIVKKFPNTQVGGIDINPEAIKLCTEVLSGALVKVGTAEDLPFSDNAADVLLSDMTLIYFSPRKVHKVIDEMKRVSRNRVVFCELHTSSFWHRMKIRLFEGYYMHDYKRLLDKHGFYDIELIKIRPEHWPESSLQQHYSNIIVATAPKRK